MTKGRIAVGEVATAKTVTFDKGRIAKLLGIVIPDDKILSILHSLNIETSIDGNTVTCLVPPYRDDIARDCDIVKNLSACTATTTSTVRLWKTATLRQAAER